MKLFSTSVIAFMLACLSAPASADLVYHAPTSVSSDAPSILHSPAVLISDAPGNGGVNYVAPNPASGGGGTSWYTNTSGSTPVNLFFEFGTARSLDDLYLWDYYGHTPTAWTLSLFSETAGGGSQLLDFDFSISPGASGTSTKHILDFTDVTGALSGTLTSRNNSSLNGVGLAEFGFSHLIAVPEPTSFVFFSISLLCIARRRRQH